MLALKESVDFNSRYLIYRHLVHTSYNVSIPARTLARAIAVGSRRADRDVFRGRALYDIMYHLNTLPPTNSLTHGILLGHRERILSRDNGGRRPSVTLGYGRTNERAHIRMYRRDVARTKRVRGGGRLS